MGNYKSPLAQNDNDPDWGRLARIMRQVEMETKNYIRKIGRDVNEVRRNLREK